MQLETARLVLRPLRLGDLGELHSVLGDPETMIFFPEPYSRERLETVIEKNRQVFEADGYGLFAVLEKASGQFIGECGITVQNIDGYDELEIGYCFAKEKWGQGFAPEAAAAMRDYGFEQLHLDKLCSYMASDHQQSRRVAEKTGMILEKEYRNPNNRDLPTTVYSIYRNLLPRPGRRIILRHLASDDLASFQAYRLDPEVGRFQGWEPQSDEEASQFIEKMSVAKLFVPDQWNQIGLADKNTNELLGDLALRLKEDTTSAEIGFSLRPQSQGQGLAFEAVSLGLQLLFDQTSLEKVEGLTDSRNTPSIRLLEGLGMTRIETIETEFRGSPCTEYLYSISRSEFENSKLLK